MSNELPCGAGPLQANKSQESQAYHAGETSGTQFLEELESRHRHVLDELEALNARIEQVLNQYAAGRQRNVA